MEKLRNELNAMSDTTLVATYCRLTRRQKPGSYMTMRHRAAGCAIVNRFVVDYLNQLAASVRGV